MEANEANKSCLMRVAQVFFLGLLFGFAPFFLEVDTFFFANVLILFCGLDIGAIH